MKIVFVRTDKVMEYDGGYAVPSIQGAGKTFVLTPLAKLIEERQGLGKYS